MKKILLPLVTMFALSLFSTSADAFFSKVKKTIQKTVKKAVKAGSHCAKKVACGKTVSVPCLKAAASRYKACRKSVAISYGRCTAGYRACISRCRRIKNPKFRALCYSNCKRRYAITNARCSAFAKTGYARCAKGYSIARTRCQRTKFRYCRASKITPRSNCLRAHSARYSACVKGAISYNNRCRVRYNACIKRCRYLRASNIVKRACYRACAKKYARTLHACSLRYRAKRSYCAKAYSAGKARCLKLPVVSCGRWSCGPCR